MPAKPSTVLDAMLVCAHPDDEIAWFGTLLPFLAQAGYRVGVVFMTSGDGGGHREVREAELRASLRTCGILGEPVCLRFPDIGYRGEGQFEDVEWVWERWDRVRARDAMVNCWRNLQPRMVFTHHHTTGDYGHPGHMATGYACLDAFDLLMREKNHDMAPRAIFQASRSASAWKIADLHPDGGVTTELRRIATAALCCHASQSVSKHPLRNELHLEVVRSRCVQSPLNEPGEVFEREWAEALIAAQNAGKCI